MKAKKHTSKLLSSLIDEIAEEEHNRLQNKMIVSANIDNLLKKKGMKKNDLAQKLGKTPSEVTRWLSGTVNMKIDTLTEIADFFKVPVYSLLKSNEEEMVVSQIYYVQSEQVSPLLLTDSAILYTNHNYKTNIHVGAC